jgi:chromosome segregation ATPase
MPQKQDTSIDDLAESISVLATAVDKGFKQVNVQFQGVNTRLDRLEIGQQSLREAQRETNQRLAKLEAAQRETNERLDRLEGNQQALEADVKELYTMLASLERAFHTFTKEQHARYKNLEDFALKISAKTGIPYHPKHA